MRALADQNPNLQIEGIEPVPQMTAPEGVSLYQGLAGDPHLRHLEGQFDVVYAIHVIEHTPDPVAFLRTLQTYATPSGKICVTCPDGRFPTAELVHGDHLFSFLPTHLIQMGEKQGWRPYHYGTLPSSWGATYDQYIAWEQGFSPDISLPKEVLDPFHLAHKRTSYCHKWQTLDDWFQETLDKEAPLTCFGAGGFTALLAGYAPRLWERVTQCVMDCQDPWQFWGKSVLPISEGLSPGLPLLIGTNPNTQGAIQQRLMHQGLRGITWNQWIPH
jgi:hypothetical protein